MENHKDPRPVVDIIIPAFNLQDMTATCAVYATANAHWPFRLTIVDDGSTPALNIPNVHCIRAPINLGFTGAVNLGVAGTENPYICILNNDTMPQYRWLATMMDLLTKDPSIGWMSPCHSQVNDLASALYNDGRELEIVPYLAGFCMLIPRHIWNIVGPLDASLGRNGMTDLDLILRMHQAGYKLAVARNAFVIHLKAKTIERLPEWKTGEYQRQNYRELRPLRDKWTDSVVDDLLANSRVRENFYHHGGSDDPAGS